ncbi:MAG TPA: hypothetical protein V6C57_01515 [Coleofasciculaceae cyanobacterium]
MQPNSSTLLTLLNEFKSHYPMGAIVAELLTIHQGNYVVRALVQVGSVSLASGMTTNPDLELAEDQAKIRALQAFGLSLPPGFNSQRATLPYMPPESAGLSYSPPPDLTLPSLPQDFLAQPSALEEPMAQNLPQTVSEIQEPVIQEPVPADSAIAPDFGLSFSPDPAQNSALDLDTHLPLLSQPPALEIPDTLAELPLPEIPVVPERTAPAKSEKSAKRKTESSPEKPPEKSSEKSPEKPESTGESSDRSNEIARIGVEMKRLGWTTEQGRNYLRRTYGKRSRQELDDVELLDFLRFLETQPSPTESLF